MEEIAGHITGQLTVTRDTALRGMVTGDAWVTGGATLTLYGYVTGNLHVDEGGVVIVHGMVDGAVINKGRVGVFGMVGEVTGYGKTYIDPNARVAR
jgi:cytoskeletal protein CcmA (bactofilin family)